MQTASVVVEAAASPVKPRKPLRSPPPSLKVDTVCDKDDGQNPFGDDGDDGGDSNPFESAGEESKPPKPPKPPTPKRVAQLEDTPREPCFIQADVDFFVFLGFSASMVPHMYALLCSLQLTVLG